MGLQIDKEFRDLISPLTKEEYSQLEQNILSEGCRDALVTWQGIILDGHNRYEICTVNNLPYATKELELSDRAAAINWIIDNQLGRRNLAPWQQSILRGKRYNAEKKPVGKPLCDQIDHIRTSEKLGEQFGVSAPTIRRDGLFATAAEHAAEETDTPVMQLTKAQIIQVAKDIQNEKREERRAERFDKLADMAQEVSLPTMRKYNVIYADPPWRYEHSISTSRDIENQYPTMPLEKICELPISDIAQDDCVLFLWATSPKLAEAIKVIEAWGFRYVTNAVWVKDRIGMGYYFRQQHELLLVAAKGNVPAPAPEARVSSVITAPRQEHSRKPDFIYQVIDKMYGSLPKIELFARNSKDGWDVWGNEI